MRRLATAGSILALAAGCGESDPPPPPPGPTPPAELSCAELRDETRLRRAARELVVRVVAPDGQSEAQTAELLASSLRATCSQPGRDRSRPVPGVLRGVQRHLDEDAIFESTK